MANVKKKKKSIIFIVFAVILSLFSILSVAFLLWQCFKLNVLPNNLMIVTAVAIGLLNLVIIILLNFYTKGIISKIFFSLLAICLIFTSLFGSFYVYKTRDMITNITTSSGKNKNIISLVTNNDTLKDIQDLKGIRIGVLKGIDENGSKACLKSIRKELNLNPEDTAPYQKIEIASLPKLASSLYSGEVDAIILNESYRNNVKEIEEFQNIDNETKIIYQATYYTDDTNEALSVSDITSSPFLIFVSGNDTEGDVEEVSRSDVNMVVAVNPLTSTVLLVSLPRDSYLPQICDEGDACLYGAYDKLTHAGLHGVNASKRTVESALDIEVNYTFRVNFDSVLRIVDAIGGITVDVPPEAVCDSFYTAPGLGCTEGINVFDGPTALAFARERYSYDDGDNQRVRNQQIVLKAIFDKCTSPSVLPRYASILEVLSGSFETNLSENEITDLIKFQLEQGPEWNFKSYQLKGYGDMLISAEMGTEVSVIVLYEGTYATAHEKIMAVLNGIDPDTIPDSVEQSEPVYYEETEYYVEEYYE